MCIRDSAIIAWVCGMSIMNYLAWAVLWISLSEAVPGDIQSETCLLYTSPEQIINKSNNHAQEEGMQHKHSLSRNHRAHGTPTWKAWRKGIRPFRHSQCSPNRLSCLFYRPHRPVSYTHLDVYKRQALMHPQHCRKCLILEYFFTHCSVKICYIQALLRFIL